MAVVIDATLGGANSNSYITLAEAETLVSERYYSGTWNDVATTDDIKNRVLVMAAKRLNREKYQGDRETSTQALPFPRIDIGYLDGILLDSIIPTQLKEAQIELAIYMLGTNMSQMGVQATQNKMIKIGSLQIQKNIDDSDNTSMSYNTLPPFVSDYLDGLLSNSSSQVSVGR